MGLGLRNTFDTLAGWLGRKARAMFARPPGIRKPTHVTLGSLLPYELTLLKSLVEEARQHPGPIVEIGTLIGCTTTNIALWKAPEQKIITIDRYCSNPWRISSDTHEAVARQMLRYLTESGQVVQLKMDRDEFFRHYQGPPPALVFLDASHDYAATKQDIQGAQSIGAKIISGHDYSVQFAGVKQAVDEFGGPAQLNGSVWRLPESPPRARAMDKSPARATELAAGRVSVIVPAYRAAAFIGQALSDVAAQSYQNWELIVVEDGTGDCAAIVQKFQQQHPLRRIVYHSKPQNSGVSNTRNQAIGLARGEFLAFLDADDRWLPDHLERKILHLNYSCADVMYCSVEMFDDETGADLAVWGPNPDDVCNFTEALFTRNFVQPSATVLRHAVILEIGLFDETLMIGEDYDLWLRAVRAGKRFAFDPKITVRYRKNHAVAATTDRIVLCNEQVGQIAQRHRRAIPGDSAARSKSIAKNFARAGYGHLSIAPSPRNGLSPRQGVHLLASAWRLRKRRIDYLAYSALAAIACRFGCADSIRPWFKSS